MEEMLLRSRGGRRLLAAVFAAMALLALGVQPSGAVERAKNLFGAKRLPAAAAPQSIGFYSKGCFAGGVGLPLDGPTWEVMRPSRNRRWGHPAMISLLEKFSRDAVSLGWSGLLLGDISQPRGGPMTDGHASHQIGLDADIWFTPMPAGGLTMSQREKMSPVSLVDEKTHRVKEDLWNPVHMRLLRQAASYPQVERILVNPGIKKKLCDTVTGDRTWLRKIRPFWGHDYHFHVRISCQPGSPDCKRQEATPNDDGCGKPLAWWFTEEPWRPNKNPDAPKARDLMTMANLPKACQAVLDAPSPASAEEATYHGAGGQPEAAPAVVEAAPEPALEAPAAANGFAATPDSRVPLPFARPRN